MTDKNILAILSDMTIIVDTRENENSHIIDYFKQSGIKYVERALKYGDYSFESGSKSFENVIVVERKASLTELSGNICQNRDRFERELEKAKEHATRFHLMVEDGSYHDILKEKYRTKLNPNSFIATLMTYESRYDVRVDFVPKEFAGRFIHGILKYYYRELLKGEMSA